VIAIPVRLTQIYPRFGQEIAHLSMTAFENNSKGTMSDEILAVVFEISDDFHRSMLKK
jgi:hypothetical protein